MAPHSNPIILTQFDRDRLARLLEAMRARPGGDSPNLEALEIELERADVVKPGEIPPNVITMNSKVELIDLDTEERLCVTVVFPGIADVKNGVMIDGRGSYSIDQQRYNGQFGGHIFWEIKNGKITRMVTDVTYNAITTDFWANLDAVTGPKEWQMFGTGGDAKGQPTQTNAISHGSPWLLIRNIMTGAAFD